MRKVVNIAIAMLVASLCACANQEVEEPPLDLFDPLIGTWRGAANEAITLTLAATGHYEFQGNDKLSGEWKRHDLGEFNIAYAFANSIRSQLEQRCKFTIAGNQLAISGCALAGTFYRTEASEARH